MIYTVLWKWILAPATALAAVALALLAAGPPARAPARERPTFQIGYTAHRTNLPGGYCPNRVTSRAFLVQGDGSDTRQLAKELAAKENQSVQLAGWSPDGSQAILHQSWESSENGEWEHKHGALRFLAEHWLVDIILLDMKSHKTTNLTSVERVSFYNAGLGFLPGKPKQFGFSAMIGGDLRPYRMDLDGKNKKPQRTGPGFIYGISPSPNGKRICYHRNYRLYLADGDGRNAQPVKDDHPFHFLPVWSPTGEWLAYLSGEHYNCHPHLIRPDGTGLRKVADRGGYRGVMATLDKTDAISERSDPLTWSPDGKWLYYTAKVGKAVELMRVSPTGKPEQLTRSRSGVFNYLPQVSPDSKWVVFGSTRTGLRQLHVARADGSGAYQLTRVKSGWGPSTHNGGPDRTTDHAAKSPRPRRPRHLLWFRHSISRASGRFRWPRGEWSRRFLHATDPKPVAFWPLDSPARVSARGDEKAAQATLLRDVFGNPFRPGRLVATWRTLVVLSLARAAYDERFLPSGHLDTARLAVLADALEEVGCSEQAILEHLRSPGLHVRGCWPVDLLLARDQDRP